MSHSVVSVEMRVVEGVKRGSGLVGCVVLMMERGGE